MSQVALQSIQAGHNKGSCSICRKPKVALDFNALYLTSGRAPGWCADFLKIDKNDAAAHVHGLGLRTQRYGETGKNVERFLELCEDAIAEGKVPITSHAYVNALRLQVDMANAVLKSHPAVKLLLSLPKAWQDELEVVMRAALTDDKALAALVEPAQVTAQVGAGTVEEAEEPPIYVEPAKPSTAPGRTSLPASFEGSGGLSAGPKRRPIVVKGQAGDDRPLDEDEGKIDD